MSTRRRHSVWQSFSDLAMGLMAVFVLVLVILLHRQDQLTADLAKEQVKTEEALKAAQEQKEIVTRLLDELTEERGNFAIELIDVFDTTYGMVQVQDGAERWLSAVFQEGPCKLRMTDRGELVIADGGDGAAASLYESGRFAMSSAGREALESCRANFLKLAYCLAPEDAPAVAVQRRGDFCGDVDTDKRSSPIDELRLGVEALILEGNTDRMPIGGGTPSIRANGRALQFETSAAGSFVDNAYLGAERARQALGNLIALVEEKNADRWDALQIMMSRLRVESPSYGRYQAGPPSWRETGCDDARNGCAAARNLSLRVRWKKEALRAPFEVIRGKMCGLLADPDSAFAKGLVSQGRDVSAERRRFGCLAAGGTDD